MGLRWTRKQQQILDELIERIYPRDDVVDDRCFATPGRKASANDLDRSTHRGQRVLHLVGDERGHLSEPDERRLLSQTRLDLDARGEIVNDARELPLAAEHHFADGKVNRERAAVLALSQDLPADADNLGLS